MPYLSTSRDFTHERALQRMDETYDPKPEDYLATGGAPHYVPLPIYHDEEKGHDIHVGEGDTAPLGCKCHTYERGSCWPDGTNCVCTDFVMPHDDAEPCSFKECPSCSRNPRQCKVRVGCECRKRALPGDIFVCNTQCHAGNGPGCGMKVSIINGQRRLLLNRLLLV